MTSIFPVSASAGQEFSGYNFDGESWNLIGNEFNPTVYSGSQPEGGKAGDIWIDSSIDVPAISPETILTINSASSTYLTKVSASTTYATKTELENLDVDLTGYLTESSASTIYATKTELDNIDLSSASAAAVAAIVDSAPSTLNTLNELAAALNDDANFSSTVTTSLGNKLDASSASTTYLSKNEASSTYLTSASMQIVPVYVMNVGGSAQRPVSASVGMFRFNTNSGEPEWYSNQTGGWINFKDSPIDGSFGSPYESPTQAKLFGANNGTSYYFKSNAMTTPVLATYIENANDSNLPYIKVFSSPFASNATVNFINQSIPFNRIYIARSTGDLWGYVLFSSNQTYATTTGIVGTTGNNNFGQTPGTKVMLGEAGQHGIYNTSQSPCNWQVTTGAIGAGFNGGCGSFPNGLIHGTGTAGSSYANTSGTYEHWVSW